MDSRESPATISADLAALAPKLARSGQIFDDPRQACGAALEELQSRERWLLIFDNARQPDDLAGYLPAHGTGDVLITSTDFHWQSVGKVQAVNAWTRPESIEFLRRRLGGIDEPHAADQLAAALGDLPLALEQAAACIEQADILIAQYLNDYEALWAEMLGQGRPLGSYPIPVAMTWELSFRRIESLNPVAAQLLTLCGFFSPDEIPLSMIENSADVLPPELAYGLLDVQARGEALNLLERFSLAKTAEGIISIHGVIAAMAQDRLLPADRMNWATLALRLASAGFSFDSQNPSSWHACAAVLPHALCSTTYAHSAGVVPTEVVNMLSRIGRFLLKQGNYSEARGLLEMAYALVKTTYGPKSAPAADIANNLARVRHRLGDLAGASALYDAAMEIDAKNYGPDDPHLATVANNSAMTLVELGRLPLARERFEWAIGVFRKSYPKNHPKIASVMNNLGFVLMQLRDYETARQWLEQSLTITESTFGANHPQVACIAVNLGAALAQGRHAPARNLFDRALLIDKAAFGANHPAVARDLLNLAQLLSDQENFDEAVRLLERRPGDHRGVVRIAASGNRAVPAGTQPRPQGHRRRRPGRGLHDAGLGRHGPAGHAITRNHRGRRRDVGVRRLLPRDSGRVGVPAHRRWTTKQRWASTPTLQTTDSPAAQPTPDFPRLREMGIDPQCLTALLSRLVESPHRHQGRGQVGANVRPIRVGPDSRKIVRDRQVRRRFLSVSSRLASLNCASTLSGRRGGFGVLRKSAVPVAHGQQRIAVMHPHLGVARVKLDGPAVELHRLFGPVLFYQKQPHAVHSDGEIGGQAKRPVEFPLGGNRVAVVFHDDAPFQMRQRLIGTACKAWRNTAAPRRGLCPARRTVDRSGWTNPHIHRRGFPRPSNSRDCRQPYFSRAQTGSDRDNPDARSGRRGRQELPTAPTARKCLSPAAASTIRPMLAWY